MKHRESGRRLLISREQSGVWLWQDPQTRAGGDAFSLVADVRGLDPKRDFGAIKKELAGLVGVNPTDFTPPPPRPPASTTAATAPRDFSAIRAAWEAAGRDPAPEYLTRDRSIPRQVITDPRFTDTHRQVAGECSFPYRDAAGALVGYERRRTPTRPDQPKASYSKGGSAGIWQSNLTPNDTALVVVESPIDAYSHFALLQLDRCPTTRYVALRTGQEATAALREAIRSMPKDAAIVGACDQGEAGDRYQKLIEAIAREEGRRFVAHQARSTDWNDELRHRVRQAQDARDHARQAEAAPTPIERPAEPAAAAPIVEPEIDDYPAPGM
jgi:hypothetical protein